MAIHAITGTMGSGKSYEAVSSKIVPALKNEEHRRIVTNIEGLSIPAIAAYIGKDEAEVEARLIRVSYTRVSEPGFWYDPETGASETVVQAGDLVVLDEVWRYFKRSDKLPEDAMRFFRMHRHYIGEKSGLTCDVVLINQAMRGIHADIRDVIEVQYACRKLKAIGAPKWYQVSVIEGGERTVSKVETHRYSPKVFALYSSYAGGVGKEAIDKRQNVIRGLLWIGIPFVVLLVGGAVYGWQTFKGSMGGDSKTPQASLGATTGAAQPSGAPGALPASAGPAAPPLARNGFAQPAPGTADEWRLAARYTVDGLPVVVLVDAAGRHRTVTAASYSVGASNDFSVLIPGSDPTRAAPWTGPAPSATRSSAGGFSK